MNVPDRPEKMTLEDLERAATEAGWAVEHTTNLHMTRPGSVSVLVETFDRSGAPYLYTTGTGKDELVCVGGDVMNPIECLTVADVMDAAERVARSDEPNTD